jgi:hypothetical protein
MLKRIAIGAMALSLAACVAPSRFEWGDYENSLYGFSKAPQTRENYRKSLQVAIARGEQTKRLAPGMYAELGYLFIEDNNNADAIASFQKEMAAFPESLTFLSSVVARLSGGAAPAAQPVSASSTPNS